MFTIQLEEPLKSGSEEIKELHFQTPRAKHFKGVKIGQDGIDYADFLKIGAKLCNLMPSQLDDLSIGDMNKVVAYVGKCWGAGLETGQNV